jgi:hypothetical protein
VKSEKEKNMVLPSREEIRSQIARGFPGLPTDTLEWVSGMLSDKIEADADTADREFYVEVERALRAGEENAILLALACVRMVAV